MGMIVLADLSMSLDNVIAVAGVARTPGLGAVCRPCCRWR
jgi:predicted tellurium resistance membrane protein TerC